MEDKFYREYSYRIPLYGGYLVVAFCSDHEELSEHISSPLKNVEGMTLFGVSFGRVYKDNQGYYLVVNPFHENPDFSEGVIAHEALHVVNMLFEEREVGYTLNNDEHACYLLMWIVDRAHEALADFKSNIIDTIEFLNDKVAKRVKSSDTPSIESIDKDEEEWESKRGLPEITSLDITDEWIRKQYNELMEHMNRNFRVNPNRFYYHLCPSCNNIIKSVAVSAGRPPYYHTCNRCKGRANIGDVRRDHPVNVVSPTEEWYRPSLEELLKMRNTMPVLDYFDVLKTIYEGKLLNRKITK